MPEQATVEHMPLQYTEAGYITDARDHAADECVVFTPDAEVLLHCVRTRQGNWRIENSDHWRFTAREWRMRMDTVPELLAAVTLSRSISLTEVSTY